MENLNTINEEFDILSFTADQLSVNNPVEPKSQGNMNIYRPRPADSKSEDHIYRTQIKVIYNPFDLKNSVLEQQSYALQDANGFFTVVSSLTDNDTSCPIFKAWKVCHYSKDENLQKQEIPVEKGGRGLFNKRFARYVTIQVLDDPNKPELNGKYMFWKMPKSIWEIINTKQKPTNPQKSPIPVMDFLFGRAIDLEVKPGPGNPGEERYSRETKYTGELTEDTVSCVNPDLTSLLTPEQQEVLDKYVESMKAVWKEKDPEVRNAKKNEVDMDPNTKQLKSFYREVIEKIKSFCPNLMESLGYKEWSQETKDRVDAWIKIVLAGNDPTVSVPLVAQTVGTTTSAASITSTTEPDPDDDLPF